MATCYRCGASNANYRRNTITGHSINSWSSGRFPGSRTYYGIRSVCQDCAKSIDKKKRVKLFFGLAVISIVLFSFLTRSTSLFKDNTLSKTSFPHYYNGETARVIPSNGLNLRDLPSLNGKVVLTIPYNETVGIIDKNGSLEMISGQTANWYKVDYNGAQGWLWSGYLKIGERHDE